jgi:hypothetical protein
MCLSLFLCALPALIRASHFTHMEQSHVWHSSAWSVTDPECSVLCCILILSLCCLFCDLHFICILGWVAVTFGEGKTCRFQAWTPGGRGVYLRRPALLPFAVNFCGPKVRRSPAYRKGKGIFWRQIWRFVPNGMKWKFPHVDTLVLRGACPR